MTKLNVNFKKLSTEAITPTKAYEGDAAFDITAINVRYEDGIITYGTGLAFEIPEGYVGYLFPRSSVYKTGLLLCNCVGVIDSGYRGEIKFKFYSYDIHKYVHKDVYQVGDRIGQLIIMPIPDIELKETTHLLDSKRSEKGWGSSGK